MRVDGRRCDQLRTMRITYDIFEYAAGSVLFELGKTKVLCAVTLQQTVPTFLKGKKTGWLTAEYAMLPVSTTNRTPRELSSASRNGRSVEISRLIGRSLRAAVNLDAIGERTIMIDCDVLQADGGTRTACITGAYLALEQAVQKWLSLKIIDTSPLLEPIAAVSVGLKNGQPLLDLDCAEDNTVDADYNFVITKSGGIVEVQGTSEKQAVEWSVLQEVCLFAIYGAQDLLQRCKQSDILVTEPNITTIPHSTRYRLAS